MSSIYTIAYASSSTYLLSQRDLELLLDEARSKNEKSGITGILLYYDGNFMQILEGPKDIVVEAYERIGHDSRHKGIIRLLSRHFPMRSFGKWTMGYVRCTEKKLEKSTEGFNVILERDRLSVLNREQMPNEIHDLLVAFHRIVYKTNMKIWDQPILNS